jgi:high-affinity nickel-transport protein
LATGFIAYGFGLRHAVDADHIAAIDNVTRKLMQEGKRPIAVGMVEGLGLVAEKVGLTAGIWSLSNLWPPILGSSATSWSGPLPQVG